MKISISAKTLAGVHTHTHTSSILIENIDKKQIEPSSICVFLM